MAAAPTHANGGHPLVDNAEPETGYEYDLVVVGGGSGGLSVSKEAAKHGKKVAVLDFVKPSPPGTVWGLGGTCVNVGCIPKKLMHNAAIIGETMAKDAKFFGWKLNEKPAFNWEDLKNNVQDYIGSLNFGYRTDLRSKNVEYINAYGVFTSPHAMELTARDGKKKSITARRFVIATGGRPRYPGIPGDKEHCITSDDLFSLETPPGKTLVVGASYVVASPRQKKYDGALLTPSHLTGMLPSSALVSLPRSALTRLSWPALSSFVASISRCVLARHIHV